MTAPYRKKLIEVALPLEAINAASVRENYIYRGNPSAVHKWWAQRPLAVCRAALFASLVDDPSSDPMFGHDADIEASKRAELFNLIEDLVQWENSNNPRVINKARAEIARCIASHKIETGELKKDQAIPLSEDAGDKASKTYTAHDIKHMLAAQEAVNHFLTIYGPPVLDPFSGGGSIPLEGQRLGLRALGYDLNPVAVLVSKALIEIPPKFAGQAPVNPEWRRRSREEKAATLWLGAQGLAADVRHYGKWMRDEAEQQIGDLYPKVKVTAAMARNRPDLEAYVGQEFEVLAWLWARTVASPSPATGGAHTPLVRSFWLSTKKSRLAYVEPTIDRQTNRYNFTVRLGQARGFDPKRGTVKRTGATCLLSGDPIPFSYIRQQGQSGLLSERLLAVVVQTPSGRTYLSPTEELEVSAKLARPDSYPDTEIPAKALGFRVQLYGMDRHYKLFTPRQLTALTVFNDLVRRVKSCVAADARRVEGLDSKSYAMALATYLAFASDKCMEYCNTIVPWYTKEDRPKGIFARQAIPMLWDYAEINPLGSIGGTLMASTEIIAGVLDSLPQSVPVGFAGHANASSHPDGEQVHAVVSTDPPYYDNIGYADLSDFFYVWCSATITFPHERQLEFPVSGAGGGSPSDN